MEICQHIFIKFPRKRLLMKLGIPAVQGNMVHGFVNSLRDSELKPHKRRQNMNLQLSLET